MAGNIGFGTQLAYSPYNQRNLLNINSYIIVTTTTHYHNCHCHHRIINSLYFLLVRTLMRRSATSTRARCCNESVAAVHHYRVC